MKFSGIFVLFLLALKLVAPAQAANHDVNNLDSFQSTINSANDGDMITVASGDYKLTQTLTISKSITLKSSGTVTLDGQNVRRVIEITGGSPTIEGFTIKNGKAGDGELTGGGIYFYANNGKLTVTNCRFENNYAENSGGGIYISSSSSSYASEIKNCTFINNKANSNSDEGGGGIFVNDGSKVDITNCTFTGNTAKDIKSGALCVAGYAGSGSATVTVNYCTFATSSDKILMNKTNTFAVKNSIIRAIVAGNDADLSYVTSADNITITTALTSEDVKDKTGYVTHTVFRKESELSSAVDSGDKTVLTDQLGNTVTDSHDIGAVEIAITHQHNFTYSASGATITATCNGAGICGLTDKKATLTVVAPTNLVYDGTAKSTTISGSIPGVNNPSINYSPSGHVNAGTYTASITLGGATASLDFTIAQKSATVTAKDQSVFINGSIDTGTGYAELSNAITGHSLSSVTLTPSSTASATTNGTITPSSAIIKDGSNNDVTANYNITYTNGTLTVNAPGISSLSVDITGDSNFTLKRGELKNFTAKVSAVYEDNSINEISAGSYTLAWSVNSDKFSINSDGELTAGMKASTGSHSITVTATASSGDVSSGTGYSASKILTVSVTSSGKTSQTSTQTQESDDGKKSQKIFTFREQNENGTASVIFASADIAVSTSSNDFRAVKDQLLTIPVSVDVNLSNDSAINKISGYSLSLDISGPEWLNISGDSLIKNIPVTSRDFKFTLAGTPTETADKTDVNITAYVVLSGDLELSASCDRNISVDVSAVTTLASVDIFADNRTLTVDKGKEGSLTLSADVYGIYSDNTRAKLSDASVAWSAVGTLPSGITLNGNVLKIASTTASGDFNLTLRASVTYNNMEANKDLTAAITVKAPVVTVNLTPATASLSVSHDRTATADFSATATATYISETKNITPAFSIEPQYEWINISSTGTVTATPTASVSAGNYSVKIKASATSDGVTQTAETTLNVTVKKTLKDIAVNFSSALKTLTVTQGATATTAAFKATATATYTDSSTASLTPTLTLESNYNWITFNASTGTVTATPTASIKADNYSVKIKASATSDGVTQTAETTLNVTVKKTLKDIAVNFSSAQKTLTVTQGATATTAAFKATATATYTDSSTASLTPTLTFESDYNWITFDASTGTVTATPTASIKADNYSVKIKATATSDGVTQTAETTLTVTVTVNVAVPKNLTFDKASITIDFDVDEGISVSDSVSVTVKDTNGNDITALGEIVCEKVTADVDWLTSTVDGNKITFTALAEKVSASKTVQFTVSFRYNGKDYLKTSYKVELYVTSVGYYYLTLSPVEITVIPGKTASLDLKNSVKFEKVFKNNHRQTVEDAKMKFSLPSGATSWTNCDPDSGVVTLNPGADVENGTLNYLYRVEAEYDGYSRTEIADFKVKVVKQSPAITTATLPTAMTGNTYSQTLTATGASPVTWTKTGGELPDGLTLNASTGKISGTPSDSGGGKTFKFTVQASNAYGTDSREFSITVILTKDAAPGSWKYNLNPDAGHYLMKSKQTFHYKRRVAKGENIYYGYNKKDIPSGKYLKSVFAWDRFDGAVKEGAGYIKFTLKYTGTTHDYVFKDEAVRAYNDYGRSYAPKRTITVTKNEKNDNGKISYAALEAEDGLITLADDEDGGEELSGSMYFDDGGTDEDGNITGVIGGENAKFKTLADFINSLTEEEYAKVIRIEFRKGAEVSKITAADIEKLTGLLEIAVDESETLTEFNLNGNKTIESVSIFKCSALEKLDVKNCAALYHLEAAQCPKLTALDVEGCSSLEAIWLNGSSVTNLNLSGSDFANVADIDLTECNSLTSLNVDGCAALSNLYAPYTAVTELNLKNNPELTDVFLNETKVETLDLSNNAKLKSLSLVGATELADLKLAEGVELEEFELTESKITELDYTGNVNITSLDLSGNTELKTLNLTDCANLKELTLTGTPIEKLTLSGCYSLEKIEAEGCASLKSLNLDKDNSNVREIYLSGSGLTALDVGACEKLTSLDVSGCTELASLNARGCSLKWLDVTACAKLAELDCSENQLGWLNLDGLTALSNVNYSGQEIYGWVADTRMKMSDYIGSNDIGRIADILAYGANEIGIETTLEDGDGNVYKADTEYYAVFKSVPEKVVYYYDTKFSGEPMDVTLTGKSSPTEIGGSGGGCSSGISAVSGLLTLIPLLWLFKKKEK